MSARRRDGQSFVVSSGIPPSVSRVFAGRVGSGVSYRYDKVAISPLWDLRVLAPLRGRERLYSSAHEFASHNMAACAALERQPRKRGRSTYRNIAPIAVGGARMPPAVWGSLENAEYKANRRST